MIYKLRCLHGRIHEFFLYCRKKIKFYIDNIIPILFFKIRNPKGVFLVFTPEHGNLGDHAIAFAEKQLLDSLNVQYYEITGKKLYELKNYNLIKSLNKSCIIINGGGNLGTLWFKDIELTIRKIIIDNPESKIIIFPNTIYYEDSDFGKEELQKSVQIYNSHRELYIYARELLSYNFMKDKYKNVKLVPDLALSLNNSADQYKRQGCILCLRSDCEKTLPSDTTNTLKTTLSTQFNKILISDMDTYYPIPVENRFYELNKKFNELKSAELVITDRLHCMIFCAFTETPCIILNSKSPKLKGCYEWIKDLGYIRFAESIDDIPTIWKEIKNISVKYSNEHLQPYFDILKKDIYEIIHT